MTIQNQIVYISIELQISKIQL